MATPEDNPELRRLLDGLVDADEAGDKIGYLEGLSDEQRAKLLEFLADEIEKEMRGGLQ